MKFSFSFKRYIYNGIININNLDVYEILELLEASDELDFNELIEDLQYYLIIEKGKIVFMCESITS